MLFLPLAWTEVRLPSIGRYLNDVTGAVYGIISDTAKSRASKNKKKRYEDEDLDAETLREVSAKLITKERLKEELAQHIEKVSYQLVWCLNLLMNLHVR